MSQRVEERMN